MKGENVVLFRTSNEYFDAIYIYAITTSMTVGRVA
jgi:hypothetical protein